MSIIMITLPVGQLDIVMSELTELTDGSLYGDVTIEVDPSVYVVRPGDMSEDVAAFAREEDAQAFRDTFEHVGDVERVLVADADTAAQMVAERSDYEVEEQAKERATCSHCLARTYRGEECICDEDEGDAEDYDEVLAELRAMRAQLYGVFWTGEGEEVQRDDEADRFPGDMEAAIHVACVTECRWLVYVEDDERWRVSAYPSKEWALDIVTTWAAYDDYGHAFFFDGHRGLDALVDGPDGIGYRLKGAQ